MLEVHLHKFSYTCRVTAVWSSRRSELGMRVAATLVVSVFAYALITGIVST